MTDFIYDFFTRAFNALGSSGIFLISVSLLTVAYIYLILRALLTSQYGMKRRIWFFPLALGICVMNFACLTASSMLALLVVAISLFYIAGTFAVPNREGKIKREQRELVRFIDEQIKSVVIPPKYESNIPQNTPQREVVEQIKETETPPKKEDASKYSLDFQHVRSVITRLDAYGLSPSDKKQVRDLETALSLAENGDFTPIIKSKINDGLGALLKIMSKYGV